MKYKCILLAAMIPFVTLPAVAGEGMKQMSFQNMDADHDGMISKTEAASNKKLTEKWSKYDANKDNMLEEAEFSRFEEEYAAKEGQKPAAPAGGMTNP
ncbi:MAG: hypothetical protein AB1810_00800 [Pseudomonadota bacterium]